MLYAAEEGASLLGVDSARSRPRWKSSAQYGVDFSVAKPGMRLSDFADEVRSRKGNLGSFEELLKTVDPHQPLQEFASRFLVVRVLVAAGTP